MVTIVVNLNPFLFVVYKYTTRQLGLTFVNHEAHEIFVLLTRHEPKMAHLAYLRFSSQSRKKKFS